MCKTTLSPAMAAPIAAAATTEPIKNTRRRPRRVAFAPQEAVVMAEVTPSSQMTQEERQDAWYEPSDLDQFKQEARDMCRELRMQQYMTNSSSSQSKAESRGLEHRISLQRQKHKFLANRAILKAQVRCHNAEDLAAVSQKCTAWARQVALQTGQKDFFAAHHPSLQIPEMHITAPFPLVRSRKRQSSTTLGQAATEVARNVRGRYDNDDNEVQQQQPMITVP